MWSCWILNLFEMFVGIGKPYFVDVVQHIVVQLMVVFAVALQNFVIFERKFDCNERVSGCSFVRTKKMSDSSRIKQSVGHNSSALRSDIKSHLHGSGRQGIWRTLMAIFSKPSFISISSCGVLFITSQIFEKIDAAEKFIGAVLIFGKFLHGFEIDDFRPRIVILTSA